MKSQIVLPALVLVSVLILSAAGTQAAGNPVQTVTQVDLNRYLGKWYEIAAFPKSFEKNCMGSMAEYFLEKNGDLRVVNTCHLKTLNGKLKQARGTARVVDPATNAKLKVIFFPPFAGDYWILDLGPDYEYAMVGTPDRKSLWFLSRTPILDSQALGHMLEKARDQGFDISRLKMTLQIGG